MSRTKTGFFVWVKKNNYRRWLLRASRFAKNSGEGPLSCFLARILLQRLPCPKSRDPRPPPPYSWFLIRPRYVFYVQIGVKNLKWMCCLVFSVKHTAMWLAVCASGLWGQTGRSNVPEAVTRAQKERSVQAFSARHHRRTCRILMRFEYIWLWCNVYCNGNNRTRYRKSNTRPLLITV